MATLAGGTAAAQLVSLAAAPILTRLFLPDDFGILAVYAAVLAIVGVGASARYQLAIPLPARDEEGIQLLAASALLPVGVAGLVAVAGVFVGEGVLELINAGALVPYLWLVPLGILGAGVYQALSYWAVRKKDYRVIARTKVAQTGAQALTQLGMGATVAGPVGLLVGYFLGQVGGSGSLFRSLWRKDRSLLREVRPGRIWEMAKRYRRFPIYSTGSAFLNRVGLQAPSLLLIGFYGPQVAGWFALGQRVLAVPLRLVGRSVSQVYVGEAAELAHDSVRKLEGLYDRTSTRLLWIAAGPALVLVAAGPVLFRFVFGEGWSEAGIYARMLAAMFLVQFAVMPISQTLNVIERQDLQLWWDAARTALALASLTLVPLSGAGARWAVGVYAASMVLAYVALYFLSRHALKRELCAEDSGLPSGTAGLDHAGPRSATPPSPSSDDS